MISKAKNISIISLITLTISLIFSVSVSAHVVVSPKEVLTSERTTFAVSVPNEHDTPVVGVRLIIPDGLTSVRPFAKTGWDIQVTKTGEGENVSATEIIWTSSGGTIPVDLKDDFLFGAKAPQDETKLIWKAYETYADGKVVAWDQQPTDSKDNMPYSVTEVVTEKSNSNSELVSSSSTSNSSMYVAIAAVVLSLIAIFLATRKK